MKEKVIRFVKKYRVPLTGLGILIVIHIGASIYSYPLEKYGIYSVATITEVSKYSRGGRISYFYFYYQGKKYEDSDLTEDLITKRDIGRRFYVKFLKDNPNRCYIPDDKQPVPDCIKEVPPEGWTEIPHCSYRDEKVTP
jgi:hypothetical protein